MGLRIPLVVVCALWACARGLNLHHPQQLRVKRQEPDPEPDDYVADVADYAGNDNNDPPKEEPTDAFDDTGNNDINEDKFGADTFDDSPPPPPPPEPKREATMEESVEVKPKKKAKKHKYLKKTFEFLKRVLDPNKLMQNAFLTEMLRRFSHNEDPDVESKESTEEEDVHTPKPVKKRRGRPKKNSKIPPGITGILKKGVMTLTQLELDRKKLKRRVKMIKRIARKAKKPLKTAVKIFLSSRNQGVGGYGGGGGYGGNNY